MSETPGPFIEVYTAVDSYRPANEDRVAVFDHPSGRVIVVADGVGGRSGSAAAAEALVDAARVALDGIADVSDADAWTDVLADADRRIAGDQKAGETTAVIVGVSARGIGGSSVGDSGAWLLQGEAYHDLTRIQQRKPYAGSGRALPIPFRRPWPSDGVLLVATDGLLKYATPQAIRTTVQASEFATAPRALIDLVRLRSGALQDDVAVALCRHI